LHRIAVKAGFTVPELYELWRKGKSGDELADRELRALLNKKPVVWEVIDVFLSTSRPAVNSKAHFALTKAVVFKAPDSIWSSAKAKWVSVESGGLPSLGKRR
jgi:hypothetical protein